MSQPDYAEYDPDAGGVGLLTWDQFDRFTRAIDNAQTHVPWWRIAGHIRSGDPDEQKTRSSDPVLPLPSTWLAAEEISNLLSEINQWSTLEDVAKFGHEFALHLTREVETAMHKWPIEDKPHKVRYLRCRECGQMTLKYYPPKEGGGAVTVKCTDPNCRAVEDPRNFAHDTALIEMENELAKRRVGDGKRSRNKNKQAQENDVRVDQGGEGEDAETGAGSLAVSA